MLTQRYAGDLLPIESWELLQSRPHARLVDVRTAPEWGFVGHPQLLSSGGPLFVSWRCYPSMTANPDFLHEISAAGLRSDTTLVLICRSGKRSRDAAIYLTDQGFESVYNVRHGFEGDKNEAGRRGALNGWRQSGLPWVQG